MFRKNINIFKKLCAKCWSFVRSHWLAKLFLNTVIGYLILSLGLYWLSSFSPKYYNKLTYWINSPQLPSVTGCRIIDKDHGYRMLGGVSVYKLEVEIKSYITGSYKLLFFTDKSYFSIYEIGSLDEENSSRRDSLVQSLEVLDSDQVDKLKMVLSVNHEAANLPLFQVGELSKKDCPITAYTLRRIN